MKAYVSMDENSPAAVVDVVFLLTLWPLRVTNILFLPIITLLNYTLRSRENKEMITSFDHLLIVEQILFVSTLGNV